MTLNEETLGSGGEDEMKENPKASETSAVDASTANDERTEKKRKRKKKQKKHGNSEVPQRQKAAPSPMTYGPATSTQGLGIRFKKSGTMTLNEKTPGSGVDDEEDTKMDDVAMTEFLDDEEEGDGGNDSD